MGFFDRPSLSVGLFSGGSEVRVAGYQRQPLPRSGGEVRGRVSFGPFGQMTRFDEIRLLDGDSSLEVLQRFSEALPLPPGAEFAHDLEIDVR
jgi:hypothetical protein